MDDDSSQPIEVTVEAEGWTEAVTGIEQLCNRVAAATLADLAPASRERIEVSLVLTDDARIRMLNSDWRGKDSATNVLSFPNLPTPGEWPVQGPLLLGDIVVALETATREAAAAGKPLEAHLAHLVAHGLLHLLGHDHEDDVEAELMESRERALMAGLGFADPYGDEAADDASMPLALPGEAA